MAGSPKRVLVIDDDRLEVAGLKGHLARQGIDDITCIERVAEAGALLAEGSYHCIFLASLGNGRISEGLKFLRNRVQESTPILLLVGSDEQEQAEKLRELGAADVLVRRRYSTELIERALRYSTQIARLQAQLHHAQRKLESITHKDAVTGLLNAEGIESAFSYELERSHRTGAPAAVLLVVCSNLAKIAENFGAEARGKALCLLADCLRRSTRGTDFLARVDADALVVLLPETSLAEAVVVGNRISLENRQHPLICYDAHVPLVLSLGTTLVCEGMGKLHEVVQTIGPQLSFSQKRRGEIAVVPSGGAAQQPSPEQLQSFGEQLIQGIGLKVVCQAAFDLELQRPIYHEFLVRGPEGIKRPDMMFSVARQLAIVPEVDLSCLRACIESARHFQAAAAVCFNLFPETILHSLEALKVLFRQESGGQTFCIDINCQWVVGGAEGLHQALAELRAIGVETSLDDMSFSRSGLETLYLLRPKIVKTQRDLCHDIANRPARQRIMQRLLSICSSMGTQLVAVGVENEEDLAAVQEIGVKYGQGYFLGRPFTFVGEPPPSGWRRS